MFVILAYTTDASEISLSFFTANTQTELLPYIISLASQGLNLKVYHITTLDKTPTRIYPTDDLDNETS